MQIPVDFGTRARLSHVKIHLRTRLVSSDLPTIWTVLSAIRDRVVTIFINRTLWGDFELIPRLRKLVFSDGFCHLIRVL